ncbi:MAG: thioredoxin domain-containing protein [Gemmatimonadota bacterium]|nr:MAG: thioredoxin domain-containing protein [Gemmatimonadota bacterium]
MSRGSAVGSSQATPNRLISEKSPYLLQHAHNPVDWYPWGKEAFDIAVKEDKPIFLSIGYSTCHWCHVMAHESFEDPEVAQAMNNTFVSIKVDKEERPDIDSIYMTVCQMMTGSGGWPLTVVMTPEKMPFFAATYIPRESRFGRVGMKELIPQIREKWKSQREEILNSAENVAGQLRRVTSVSPGAELGRDVLTAAFRTLSRRFDEHYGGFGKAPKFPTPHNLTFLLRYWKSTGDEKALRMAEKTLQFMRRGGVYDHIGFGFHRYSTDERWLVPHFEKMLYDQALLTMAYVEAYQATGKEEYKRTGEEVLSYVLRDMTSPEGGFYSAEDADSEGEEGKFYLWEEGEIRGVLPPEEAEVIIRALNVEEKGNFRGESTGEKTNENILHLRMSLAESVPELGLEQGELLHRLESARRALFDVRQRRPRPFRDEKILTDWNGLMIAALAKAARVFDNADYTNAAGTATAFVLSRMRDKEGRLYHRFGDGEVALGGFLDDYAFFTWGLIEMYETTFEVDYLKAALEMTERMIHHFWDKSEGGFYFTADDAETTLIRRKEIYDGAIPSGNSVAMLNLLRLGRMTARPEFAENAAHIGRAFSKDIERTPVAYTQLMSALDFQSGESYEVVLVGDVLSADTKVMLDALRKRFLPKTVVLFSPAHGESSEISKLADYTQSMSSINGKTTAYVCQNYSCKQPTTDVRKVLQILKEK